MLNTYLNFPPVRYALIVGVLIALCSSLLGITLVLKRFSFIGDGLSHVAFGAMAIAGVLHLTNDMLFVLPATVLAAVLLLRTGQHTKIKGDAAIAMISVGALAVGYMLLSVFSTSANLSGDVCSTLFGSTSILTLTKAEVWLCAGLSAAVILIFVLFYNRIFAVTFDETFARATGLNAKLYNTVIAVLTALIIVVGMRMMGSLLISSLVVFPAVTSMRTCITFRSVMICSAVVSTICLVTGLVISYLYAAPTGASIVLCNIAAFILFAAVQKGRECLQSREKSL
jgi:zinc transport system permease protein